MQPNIIPDKEIKKDEYDKKILFYLSQDFRHPRKQLARKLKLPLHKLNYKIERLKNELLDPAVILNYPELKIDSHILLIKRPSEKVKQLLGNKHLYTLVETVGKYQSLVIVMTEDIMEFCKKYLPDEDMTILPLTEYKVDNFNPHNYEYEHEKINQMEKRELDKYDYRVLYNLCLDPEISLLSLSNKAKIDRKTATTRFKYLLDSYAVEKIRYIINIAKAGFMLYFLLIRVPPRSKSKIITHIENHKYSGFTHISNNFIINQQIVPSNVELSEFVRKIHEIEPDAEIDVLMNNGEFHVEKIAKYALEIIKKRQ